jgi:hypothetical protein
VFVAVRAAGYDFARGGAIDAGKIEKLGFGRGVQIDKRVLAFVPAVTDALGGGASLVGGVVGGFTDFSAGVLDCRLGALGGAGDFVAGSFVARALIGIVGSATTGTGQNEGARKAKDQSWQTTRRPHERSSDLAANRGRMIAALTLECQPCFEFWYESGP